MRQTVQRELRFLRLYAALNTAVLAILFLTGAHPGEKTAKFTEVNVERLNVVDSDGRHRFVLTNGARSPGAIIGGKEYERSNSNKTPAIIFYNEDGDESGARVSAGRKKDDGGYCASSRLVFDRFRQNELLAFQYYEDPLGGFAGVLVTDQPDTPITEWLEGNAAIRAMPEGPAKAEALEKFRASVGGAAKRLFVGRTKSKAAEVDLADANGNTRLRLSVDSLGTPWLDFLSEDGLCTYSLPGSAAGAAHQESR